VEETRLGLAEHGRRITSLESRGAQTSQGNGHGHAPPPAALQEHYSEDRDHDDDTEEGEEAGRDSPNPVTADGTAKPAREPIPVSSAHAEKKGAKDDRGDHPVVGGAGERPPIMAAFTLTNESPRDPEPQVVPGFMLTSESPRDEETPVAPPFSGGFQGMDAGGGGGWAPNKKSSSLRSRLGIPDLAGPSSDDDSQSQSAGSRSPAMAKPAVPPLSLGGSKAASPPVSPPLPLSPMSGGVEEVDMVEEDEDIQSFHDDDEEEEEDEIDRKLRLQQEQRRAAPPTQATGSKPWGNLSVQVDAKEEVETKGPPGGGADAKEPARTTTDQRVPVLAPLPALKGKGLLKPLRLDQLPKDGTTSPPAPQPQAKPAAPPKLGSASSSPPPRSASASPSPPRSSSTSPFPLVAHKPEVKPAGPLVSVPLSVASLTYDSPLHESDASSDFSAPHPGPGTPGDASLSGDDASESPTPRAGLGLRTDTDPVRRVRVSVPASPPLADDGEVHFHSGKSSSPSPRVPPSPTSLKIPSPRTWVANPGAIPSPISPPRIHPPPPDAPGKRSLPPPIDMTKTLPPPPDAPGKRSLPPPIDMTKTLPTGRSALVTVPMEGAPRSVSGSPYDTDGEGRGGYEDEDFPDYDGEDGDFPHHHERLSPKGGGNNSAFAMPGYMSPRPPRGVGSELSGDDYDSEEDSLAPPPRGHHESPQAQARSDASTPVDLAADDDDEEDGEYDPMNLEDRLRRAQRKFQKLSRPGPGGQDWIPSSKFKVLVEALGLHLQGKGLREQTRLDEGGRIRMDKFLDWLAQLPLDEDDGEDYDDIPSARDSARGDAGPMASAGPTAGGGGAANSRTQTPQRLPSVSERDDDEASHASGHQHVRFREATADDLSSAGEGTIEGPGAGEGFNDEDDEEDDDQMWPIGTNNFGQNERNATRKPFPL
jgi:hypothetical protein